MKKIILLAFVITATIFTANSQGVGIGTTAPDNSAILELKATDKGFLPPRMKAAEKALIPSPQAGLIVYQTDGTTGLYIYNGSAWNAVSGAANGGSSWGLNGNTGTNPASNFIGTTDNQPLKFRVNNLPAGEINFITANTAFGSNALLKNSTGTENIGIGFNSMHENTLGNGNAAVGLSSLYSNIDGSNNTATGINALYSNQHGDENAAFGAYALYNNITGNTNIALGTFSLYSNTTGYSNVAIGKGTLYKNTINSRLLAIGDSALYNNAKTATLPTEGIFNVAVGSKALYANDKGSANSAVGFAALTKNTIGYNNSAFGTNALLNNQTGNGNVAFGTNTLYYGSSGSANSAFGSSALFNNQTGNSNVALGENTLYFNTKGYSNIAIGSNALYQNTINSGLVAIGDSALYNNAKTATLPTDGTHNIALGSKALYANNTGSNNSAAGFNALTNNSAGAANSAFGGYALYANQTGNSNNAVGFDALGNSTTGSENTANGYYALLANTTGSQNSAFGSRATVASGNLNNATAIGANAQANCSNCMILGSVNNINGATSSTNVAIGVTTPQARLHVSPNSAGGILIGNDKFTGGYTTLEMGISAQSSGYSFIQSTSASGTTYGNLALNASGGFVGIHTNTPLTPLHIKQYKEAYPVTDGGLRLERQTNAAHWDIAIDQYNALDFAFNGNVKAFMDPVNGTFTTASDARLKKDIRLVGTVMPSVMQLQVKSYHYKDNDADAALSYGFIAQEVEKVFPDFVATKGVDAMKAITYQNFAVIAIKAIQEQEVTIENLNKRVNDLENKMEEIIKNTTK